MSTDVAMFSGPHSEGLSLLVVQVIQGNAEVTSPSSTTLYLGVVTRLVGRLSEESGATRRVKTEVCGAVAHHRAWCAHGQVQKTEKVGWSTRVVGR